jgi:predicted nucleic acid-binding protein
MFILDTNVLSELIKPQGDQVVLTWYSQQHRHKIYSTVITLSEMLTGLLQLPDGKKRAALERNFTKQHDGHWQGRFLPFDAAAAQLYSVISHDLRVSGFTVGIPDRQIAAIARAHNATLITRNTKDFASCGIALINPWDMMRP